MEELKRKNIYLQKMLDVQIAYANELEERIDHLTGKKELIGPDTIVVRVDGRDFSIQESEFHLLVDAEDVTKEYDGKLAPCLERVRNTNKP